MARNGGEKDIRDDGRPPPVDQHSARVDVPRNNANYVHESQLLNTQVIMWFHGAKMPALMSSGLKVLPALLANTDSAALASPEGEAKAAGADAKLSLVLRGLRYLDDTTGVPSSRDWVSDEEPDSWLFITVRADQLATLRTIVNIRQRIHEPRASRQGRL